MEDPQLADNVSNNIKAIGGQVQAPQQNNPIEKVVTINGEGNVEETDEEDDDEDLIDATDIEDRDDQEYDIPHISNAQDLSPRHTKASKQRKESPKWHFK